VLLGCRCAIGLVFVASVLGKVRGREAYVEFIRAAGRLGPDWVTSRIPARMVAGGVIAAEAAVVVLLVLPATAWAGFGLAALLALQRHRYWLAILFAILCPLGSPVAGLFLAMAGVAYAIAERRALSRQRSGGVAGADR